MSETAPIPPAFREALAGLEEQLYPSLPGKPFDDCFGCGREHATGLRVRCFRTADGILSPIVIATHHEGPRGAAHGGIIAAYMDEILSGAIFRGVGGQFITGELSVRFVAPVPTETPLLGRGRLTADHGRYADAEATLEVLDTGRVVAKGRARFFPLKRSG